MQRRYVTVTGTCGIRIFYSKLDA